MSMFSELSDTYLLRLKKNCEELLDPIVGEASGDEVYDVATNVPELISEIIRLRELIGNALIKVK